MKYLFSLLVLACSCCAGYAQNIYGRAHSTTLELRQLSTHTMGDSVIISSFPFGGGSIVQSTTDLKSMYFYMPESLFYPSGQYPWTIEIVDVKNKTRVSDTVVEGSFSFPEYHDDTLWGISSHGISYYDIKTGTVHPYHNVLHGPDIVPFYKGVQKSAFDHNTMTYMFSKRGVPAGASDTFYMVKIRTKQITRHLVPKEFVYFDYSPLNDRCYFMNGFNLDSAKGIYEYNLHTNVLTLHHDWGKHHGVLEATFDPVKNRLYFISVRQTNPIIDIIGCYRINSRKNDFYKLSASYNWLFIEYLNTYNDTTNDPFPAGIGDVAGNAAGSLVIYPNPAKNTLTAETALNGEVEAVTWDMQGRIVKREKVNSQAGRLTLDVSSLATGRYILGLSSPQGEQSAVFTVER